MKIQENERNEQESGFTLIELLIAIVVVGILTAVAIVGIGGLTNNGKTSACKASVDAAKAASAVYYANNNGVYPASFTDMTADTSTTPASVDFDASSVTIDGTGKIMSHGTDWSVTMGGGGAAVPTFTKTGGGAACS